MSFYNQIGWLFADGYFIAFAAGMIVTNFIHMYLNTSQIRRNSETIRRKYEKDFGLDEATDGEAFSSCTAG